MKLAIINEAECIGCAKCLPACPVDAIIGAPKFLHTVLTEECIGCGLCLAPCPVDCIKMVESHIPDGSTEKVERAAKAKRRYQNRLKRLNDELKLLPHFDTHNKDKIQTELKAAINRVKSKKLKNP